MENSSIQRSELKKKKRRRRRRRGPVAEVAANEDHLRIYSPSASPAPHAVVRRRPGPRMPVLRPVGAEVPRAPENSTQFIIDDHENSAMFVDFDKFGKTVKDDGGESLQPVGDWYPFSVADFERAYRTAREEKLMATSRSDLKAAIVALETRAALLSEALGDSQSGILGPLQEQLLALQEENRALRASITRRQQKQQRKDNEATSSSTSSSSDSDSDSSVTSSMCSDSDCETCLRKKRRASEEEKENTCPTEHSVQPSALREEH